LPAGSPLERIGARGRIAAGMAAGLVVLDGDPAEDGRRFAAAKCVVRARRVIYAGQISRRPAQRLRHRGRRMRL